jgi:hypothetical protein
VREPVEPGFVAAVALHQATRGVVSLQISRTMSRSGGLTR